MFSFHVRACILLYAMVMHGGTAASPTLCHPRAAKSICSEENNLAADETYSSLRTQLSLDLRLIILTSSLIICSLFLFVLKRNSEKPDP